MKKITKNNIPNNEVIIYESPSGEPRISVRVENETVWLTIDQMTKLFGKEPVNN